jgi:O-antigen/teichoic acid export membrane protein
VTNGSTARPSVVLVLLGALFIIVGIAANGMAAAVLVITGVVLIAVFVAGWIRSWGQGSDSGPVD